MGSAKYSFTHLWGPMQNFLSHSDPRDQYLCHPSTQQHTHSSPRPLPGARLSPSHIFGGGWSSSGASTQFGGGWKICAPLSRHPEAVKGWAAKRLCGPSHAGRALWRAAPLPHAPASSWPSPDILHRFAQPCRSCSRAPAGISHSGWGSPFSKASWRYPAGGRATVPVRSSPLRCWAGSGAELGSVVPEPLGEAF